MVSPPGNALVQSYHEVCRELNCEPLPDFLDCLQSGAKVCRLSSVQQEEQLYSTISLLPYLDLEELDVSGLKLEADGWTSLAEGAAKCRGLQVLSLKGCSLGKLGHTAQSSLATHIGNSSVAVLDLSQNGLGDGFVLALCNTPLVTEGQNLSVLDLSENAVTCSGASLLAASLEAAGGGCNLRQLDLSFNLLSDEGAAALASLVGAIPLVALELEGNRVSDVGGLALAAAIGDGGNGRLQRLNLNSNRLTAETQKALAGALKDGSSVLLELAVSGCTGGDSGAAALFSALVGNAQLQLLDVRGASVGHAAAAALCSAMSDPSCGLVTLRMDVANKEAAEAIAHALPGNSRLLQLMMGGPVPEHVLSFIGATISSNALNRLAAASESSGAAAAVASPASGGGAAAAAAGGHSVRSSRAGAVQWADGSSSAPEGSPGGPPARAGSFHANSSGGRPRSVSPGQSPGRELGGSWQRSPGRPASAGDSPGARRSLSRSLTQRAKALGWMDPSGLGGLAGGGSAQKAADVFKRHDSDASGYLDAEEMMGALADLGMLEGMKPRALGKFLSNAIKEADTDQDGRVSLPEFVRYYERLARHYADAARQGRIAARSRLPLVPINAASDPNLVRGFKAYCRVPIGQGRQVGGSVQHINAAQFNLLARDVGLVEPAGPLSQCAVDIIFTRCKPAGSRRLTFKEFLEAMTMVCEEAGMDFAEVTAAMTRAATAPGTPVTGQRGAPQGYPDYPGMFGEDVPQLAPAPASARRGSLTDNKVGPSLPQAGVLGVAKGGGILSKLRFTPAGSERAPSPTFVHGSGSPTASAARRASGSAPSGAAGSLGTGNSGGSCEAVAGNGAAGLRVTYPPTDGSPTAGHRQNPLYEGSDRQLAGDSGVGEQQAALDSLGATAKQLAARLGALEQRMAASSTGSIRASADPPSPVEARLAALEEAAAARQSQLELLASQQGELQRLVLRLADGLDALRSSSAASGGAEVNALKQQVSELASQVSKVDKVAQAAQEAAASKVGSPELLSVVERKMGARQSRMEDALMQVARQVDVLDMRLKEEQESSLKALEAILGGATPSRS